MADISTFLKNILSARYGRDVRQSIHDAIDAVNTSAEGSAASAANSATEAAMGEANANQYAENAYDYADKASEYSAEASEYKGDAYVYKEEAKAAAEEAKAAAEEAKAATDITEKSITFSQAATRENIASGETVATIFGKVMKYFADIRPFAFNPMVNDLLSTTPYRALDSRQGPVIAQMISDATTPVNITGEIIMNTTDLLNGEVNVFKIGKLVIVDYLGIEANDKTSTILSLAYNLPKPVLISSSAVFNDDGMSGWCYIGQTIANIGGSNQNTWTLRIGSNAAFDLDSGYWGQIIYLTE